MNRKNQKVINFYAGTKKRLYQIRRPGGPACCVMPAGGNPRQNRRDFVHLRQGDDFIALRGPETLVHRVARMKQDPRRRSFCCEMEVAEELPEGG